MRLIECKIQGFGCLVDVDYQFNNGLNCFCENNGFGKSTLAAFIRVMFFGFEGERKVIEERERTKYIPWEGRFYGGQIKFETGGKTYNMYRTFGEKAKDDKFVLKDAYTNLESKDYSKDIGIELFGIDSDSYRRSAYITQLDCMTNTTDDINSKIGNLSDDTNDLNNYEKVMDKLGANINLLTPDRKSGRLAKLENEITGLKTAIRDEAYLDEQIKSISEKREAATEALGKLKDRKSRNSSLRTRVAASSDREHYEDICRIARDAEKECEEIQTRLQKGIPEDDEITSAMAAYSSYVRYSEDARNLELNEDYLNNRAHSSGSDSSNNAEGNNSINTDRGVSIAGVVLLIAGMLIVVMSFLTPMEFLLIPGIVVTAIGILCMIGRMVKSTAKPDTNINQAEIEEQLKAVRLEHIKELKDKALEEKHRFDEFLHRYGISSAGANAETVAAIRDIKVQLAAAKKAYDSACANKMEFEKDHDVNKFISYVSMENMPKFKELDEDISKAEREIEVKRQELESISKELDNLMGRLDERNENIMLLEEKEKEKADISKKYEMLKKLQHHLENAKLSLTSKYSRSVQNRFGYYLELLGEKSGEYQVDADSNVMYESAGLPREAKNLSVGYQDLLGFCLRMAFVDSMFDAEKPFLILDDPFVNLDKDKLEYGMKMVDEIAEKYQVIYFTCHESRFRRK